MSEHLQRNKEEALLGNASERLITRARAGSNAEHRMIGSGDRKLASSLSSVDRQRLTSQLVGIHSQLHFSMHERVEQQMCMW